MDYTKLSWDNVRLRILRSIDNKTYIGKRIEDSKVSAIKEYVNNLFTTDEKLYGLYYDNMRKLFVDNLLPDVKMIYKNEILDIVIYSSMDDEYISDIMDKMCRTYWNKIGGINKLTDYISTTTNIWHDVMKYLYKGKNNVRTYLESELNGKETDTEDNSFNLIIRHPVVYSKVPQGIEGLKEINVIMINGTSYINTRFNIDTKCVVYYKSITDMYKILFDTKISNKVYYTNDKEMINVFKDIIDRYIDIKKWIGNKDNDAETYRNIHSNLIQMLYVGYNIHILTKSLYHKEYKEIMDNILLDKGSIMFSYQFYSETINNIYNILKDNKIDKNTYRDLIHLSFSKILDDDVTKGYYLSEVITNFIERLKSNPKEIDTIINETMKEQLRSNINLSI